MAGVFGEEVSRSRARQRVRERHDLSTPNANDGSRLEVVVEGLPLFVGALQSDGTACVGGKHGEWHSWRETTFATEEGGTSVPWRWASILSCAATRAVAESLSGLKRGPGVGKMVQAIDDVIEDHKYRRVDGAGCGVTRFVLTCGTTGSSFVDILHFPVFAHPKIFVFQIGSSGLDQGRRSLVGSSLVRSSLVGSSGFGLKFLQGEFRSWSVLEIQCCF